MKKLSITAACIAITLCSFANPATGNNKKGTGTQATINASVVATGTRVIVTAISELPAAIEVTLTDARGNEVYEGKLIKNEFTQNAIFNLEQLSEGTYTIVLQNSKERYEKKITVNTSTTKQLAVE